jgi:hypothetical protein
MTVLQQLAVLGDSSSSYAVPQALHCLQRLWMYQLTFSQQPYCQQRSLSKQDVLAWVISVGH